VKNLVLKFAFQIQPAALQHGGAHAGRRVRGEGRDEGALLAHQARAKRGEALHVESS
jgi:hypothetical protein